MGFSAKESVMNARELKFMNKNNNKMATSIERAWINKNKNIPVTTGQNVQRVRSHMDTEFMMW